jgi:hypothetical protein
LAVFVYTWPPLTGVATPLPPSFLSYLLLSFLSFLCPCSSLYLSFLSSLIIFLFSALHCYENGLGLNPKLQTLNPVHVGAHRIRHQELVHFVHRLLCARRCSHTSYIPFLPVCMMRSKGHVCIHTHTQHIYIHTHTHTYTHTHTHLMGGATCVCVCVCVCATSTLTPRMAT